MKAGQVAAWALAAGLAASGSCAFAWGKEGHQAIAIAAATQLTPKARAEVERLLALESGATLASISTWADEQRDRSTAAWHYVNMPPGDCNYQPARDCPGGACVVDALSRELAVLASTAPDERRLLALKFVVHFAGDVHQPLHAGHADDKGGNNYQIQYNGRGTNLHSLWDSGLIRGMGLDGPALAQRIADVQPNGAADLGPVHAAMESCRIVEAAGFYPDRKPGAEYLEAHGPVMLGRLATAGARLAGMLSQSLN